MVTRGPCTLCSGFGDLTPPASMHRLQHEEPGPRHIYADFGWVGVVFESAAVGCLATFSFRYLQQRTELAWILYACLAYVLTFTVYVWYPARPDVYFDAAVFVTFSVFARRRQARSAEDR